MAHTHGVMVFRTGKTRDSSGSEKLRENQGQIRESGPETVNLVFYRLETISFSEFEQNSSKNHVTHHHPPLDLALPPTTFRIMNVRQKINRGMKKNSLVFQRNS